MNCEEVINLFIDQKENENAATAIVIKDHLESCDEYSQISPGKQYPLIEVKRIPASRYYFYILFAASGYRSE